MNEQTPLWIKIGEDGEIFEGHQGHWADVYFSNATSSQILHVLADKSGQIWPWDECTLIEVRPMTQAELGKFPEAIEMRDWLVAEYGEI